MTKVSKNKDLKEAIKFLKQFHSLSFKQRQDFINKLEKKCAKRGV